MGTGCVCGSLDCPICSPHPTYVGARPKKKGGRSSRRKGANGEREVAHALEEIYPNARRGLQYQSYMVGREREQDRIRAEDKGIDVKVTRRVRECDVENTPFWVECKRGKKTRIIPALEQARRDSDGRAPMAVTRNDQGEWTVTMYLKDWIQYVEKLRDRMKLSEFDEIHTTVI